MVTKVKEHRISGDFILLEKQIQNSVMVDLEVKTCLESNKTISVNENYVKQEERKKNKQLYKSLYR